MLCHFTNSLRILIRKYKSQRSSIWSIKIRYIVSHTGNAKVNIKTKTEQYILTITKWPNFNMIQGLLKHQKRIIKIIKPLSVLIPFIKSTILELNKCDQISSLQKRASIKLLTLSSFTSLAFISLNSAVGPAGRWHKTIPSWKLKNQQLHTWILNYKKIKTQLRKSFNISIIYFFEKWKIGT